MRFGVRTSTSRVVFATDIWMDVQHNNEQQTKSHSTTKQNPKHQRTSSKHSINKDKQRDPNNNNNNTKYPHPKLFINYTSQYGNYFDTPLQRGGLSKIPSYIKHKNQTQT